MSSKTFEDYLLAELASGVHFLGIGEQRSDRGDSEIHAAIRATDVTTAAVCRVLGHTAPHDCPRCRQGWAR